MDYSFLNIAKQLNDYGFWSALSVLAQVVIVILGLTFVSRRRRVPNLNFTFALVEGELKDRTHSRRQLTILVRNLSGTDVLIGAACFVTKNRNAISEYADGDTASNEYELKFKSGDELFSNAFTLIKSTHHVFTWVPASETMKAKEVINAIHGRSFIRCKIILLTRRPEIISCKIPVMNVQYRQHGLYYVSSNTNSEQIPADEKHIENNIQQSTETEGDNNAIV
ncbi:MAG: hypothetical protein ABL933_11395 [Methyloglobulus sp.]|nr:hypothetical protein [Methyloglobulus sp.]